ncbi:phosphatase PAP2 family protein [Hydrogenophaga sp. PBL-H3]|uniref:phosphatase PAP2 family protein n=1 Tax=Hydrogenophaga sp. PBL-H3 TaxID=434010 RepID=UPI00131FD7D5|nr:phosphatase PAP2 family protein [Hydrogenophaga sp. PBL-H3]QHE77944.1 phosphatase PAP2 family protein [Hydrogenophaga sp. PBL-H3]QHE82368.1 phosphatase PAP2 family protein [Hydrogenophaga sp. PBL-H3]
MTSIDNALFLWINATPATPPGLIALARWCSEVLPTVALLALAPLALAGQQARRQVMGAALAMALAWLAVRGLKGVFDMPRPFTLGLGHQWIPHAVTPAFPSYHATVSAAWSAGLLFHARRHLRVWILLAGCVTLAIAWSRVFLGVHFVSDVAMGLALGVSCALVARQCMAGAAGWLGAFRSRQVGSGIR